MRYMLLWPLLMALLSCHGEDSQLDSINEDLRDDFNNISLIKNDNPNTDRLPNQPMNPAYFIVMRDSEKFRGYPINCAQEEIGKVLGAFGLSDSPLNTKVSLDFLKSEYKVDQQPVLNCSAIRATADQRQISAVFRLQNPEGQAARPNPSYYVKFLDFPDRIFQVGCLDILNSFAAGNGESVNFAEKAIPLSDPRALYYMGQDVPDTGLSADTKGDKGIQRLFCRESSLALPQPAPLAREPVAAYSNSESRLLQVKTAEDNYYVYAWKDRARRVECPGASEGDILKAFDFAPSEKAVAASPTDPVVVLAGEQEILRCVNIFSQSFSVGFRTVDVLPEQHAFKSSRESPELVTFGCASAETFFVGDTIEKEQMIPVASRSLDFLLSHPHPAKITQNVDRIHIPCADRASAPQREDIQTAYLRVFGAPAYPDIVEFHEAKIKTTQIRSTEDIVDYFVNGLASTPSEAEMITTRAFRTAKGRDPTAAEKTLFADLMLNQRKIRPHFNELVVLLFFFYDDKTMQGTWHCIGCDSDPSTLEIETVQLAFLEVFGLTVEQGWANEMAADMRTKLKSFRLKDVVNYYVNGMAQSEDEAKRISERAFRSAIFRDATPQEVVLVQNLILKGTLRPHYLEVAAYLRSVPLPKATVLQDGKTYRFMLASSGKCLDIPNTSLEDGAIPQQWGCNGGRAQDFVVRALGNGYYNLVLKASDKCLDIYDGQTADATKMLQWKCHGGANQKFFAERAEDGYIRFKPANSGLCLEAKTATLDNGVAIQQGVCRPAQRSQLWIPYTVAASGSTLEDGRTYSFVSKPSTKCIDISGSSKDNGAIVQQWICNGTTAQQYRAQREANGSYKLINISSSKCLEVTGSSTTAGAKLQQSECVAGRTSQRFSAEKSSDGNLLLKAGHSGQCVDLANTTTDNGVRVQQAVCKADVKTQVWITYQWPAVP